MDIKQQISNYFSFGWLGKVKDVAGQFFGAPKRPAPVPKELLKKIWMEFEPVMSLKELKRWPGTQAWPIISNVSLQLTAHGRKHSLGTGGPVWERYMQRRSSSECTEMSPKSPTDIVTGMVSELLDILNGSYYKTASSFDELKVKSDRISGHVSSIERMIDEYDIKKEVQQNMDDLLAKAWACEQAMKVHCFHEAYQYFQGWNKDMTDYINSQDSEELTFSVYEHHQVIKKEIDQATYVAVDSIRLGREINMAHQASTLFAQCKVLQLLWREKNSLYISELEKNGFEFEDENDADGESESEDESESEESGSEEESEDEV